jgi:Ca2+-binding RTX toxin-like protein
MTARLRGTTALLLALGLAVAALLALPGAAMATITAETTGDTMVVNGDSSNNMINFEWNKQRPELLSVSNPRTPSEPLSAGGACEAGTDPVHMTPELRCPLAGLRRASISVGDGSDSVSVSVDNADELLPDLFPIPVSVIGGNGNDNLQTAGWHGRAFGENGDDVLYGRSGPSYLSGGNGNDNVTDPEGGNDRLDGGDQGDVLDSFGGRDVVIGGTGRDVMRAGTGRDRIYAGDGTRDKRIRCGPGGSDFAIRDAEDPRPQLCERVRTP